MMLGAGLGFAIYRPLTDDNPVGSLGTGAAIIQGISAVVSLWVGGWVAGRFTGRHGLRSGRIHGFMVWCLSTVVAIAAVTFGAGWALGDVAKLVGGGLSAAGKVAAPAVSGAADLTKEAVSRSGATLQSFVDEGLTTRTNNDPGAVIRAKREVGFAVTHYFTTGNADKQQLVQVLRTQGYSEADANRLIDDWTASYNRLKADLNAAKEAAEQKAREVADEAADTLAVLSLVAFVAFVIGAIAAACGGRHGGKIAQRNADLVVSAIV